MESRNPNMTEAQKKAMYLYHCLTEDLTKISFELYTIFCTWVADWAVEHKMDVYIGVNKDEELVARTNGWREWCYKNAPKVHYKYWLEPMLNRKYSSRSSLIEIAEDIKDE